MSGDYPHEQVGVTSDDLRHLNIDSPVGESYALPGPITDDELPEYIGAPHKMGRGNNVGSCEGIKKLARLRDAIGYYKLSDALPCKERVVAKR